MEQRAALRVPCLPLLIRLVLASGFRALHFTPSQKHPGQDGCSVAPLLYDGALQRCSSPVANWPCWPVTRELTGWADPPAPASLVLGSRHVSTYLYKYAFFQELFLFSLFYYFKTFSIIHFDCIRTSCSLFFSQRKKHNPMKLKTTQKPPIRQKLPNYTKKYDRHGVCFM